MDDTALTGVLNTVGFGPMSGQPGDARIDVEPNGPYRVVGLPLSRMRPVQGPDGRPFSWERTADLAHEDAYRLCRCGASATKPFCDGTEERIGFDGTETADRAPGAERRFRLGGDLQLSDDPSICSKAAFCMRATTDAWELVEEASDPARRALLVEMVGNCPSGRLALHQGSEVQPQEQPLGPEVAVIDDGPLWVRGGVQVVSADGLAYEVRNRMTLCRCGHSRNKPFCDGSHRTVGFVDPPS
jgi:CDGSH-type Zn-finger protein